MLWFNQIGRSPPPINDDEIIEYGTTCAIFGIAVGLGYTIARGDKTGMAGITLLGEGTLNAIGGGIGGLMIGFSVRNDPSTAFPAGIMIGMCMY